MGEENEAEAKTAEPDAGDVREEKKKPPPKPSGFAKLIEFMKTTAGLLTALAAVIGAGLAVYKLWGEEEPKAVASTVLPAGGEGATRPPAEPPPGGAQGGEARQELWFVASSFSQAKRDDAIIQAKVLEQRRYKVRVVEGDLQGFVLVCGPYPTPEMRKQEMDRLKADYPNATPYESPPKPGAQIYP